MKKIKPPAELNERQRRFAELVAGGASYTEAYIGAGYSKDGAMQNSSRLMRNDDVATYVTELSIQAANGRALAAQEELDIMADIARNEEAKDADRVQAVKTSAMIQGRLKRDGGGIGQLNVSVVNVRERTQEEEEQFIERFNRVTGQKKEPALNGANGHKNGGN